MSTPSPSAIAALTRPDHSNSEGNGMKLAQPAPDVGELPTQEKMAEMLEQFFDEKYPYPHGMIEQNYYVAGRILAALTAASAGDAASEDTRIVDWLIAHNCSITVRYSGIGYGGAWVQSFKDRKGIDAAMKERAT